jgi:RsiW-degrading membrane proteinase PrsW (M82 family)
MTDNQPADDHIPEIIEYEELHDNNADVTAANPIPTLSANTKPATTPLPPILPIPLSIQTSTKPPILRDTPVSQSPFKMQNLSNTQDHCDSRSLLIFGILIAYLWFSIAGVTEGNVSWPIVMLLLAACIWLSWYAFLGLTKLTPERGEVLLLRAIKIFFITAAVGMLLLFLFQEAVTWVDENWKRPGVGRRVGFLFLIVKIIATGYRTAFDIGELPNPAWYFICTFCSVAICEEFLKLMPVLFLVADVNSDTPTPSQTHSPATQELLFFGAISGLGFGISEALMYTAEFYRPLHLGFSVYLVRFLCVAILHGLLCYLSTAVYLHLAVYRVAQEEWKRIGLALLLPMCLHSLHNTADAYDWKFLGFLVIASTIGATLAISIALRKPLEVPANPEESTAK